MLHILHPRAPHKCSLSLSEILNHRLDFLKSEKIESVHPQGKDVFDTPHTLYAAYQSPLHGIMGSARILPKSALPEEVAQEMPSNQDFPFVLVDCLFHLSETTGFYEMPDAVVRSQFNHLLKDYYTSLVTYLENRALKDQAPMMYFYLSEEEFDFLSQFSERDLFVMKEKINGPDFENHYVGAIDFSDLFYNLPQEAAPTQNAGMLHAFTGALGRQ